MAVPGSGNSSPVVWGDQLFLTSTVDHGQGPQVTVLCYERSTGTLRWQQPIGAPQGPSHQKNGHASGTLAVDASRVVAPLNDGALVALDFDGNLLWHTPPASQRHQWGTASSPLLFDNLVIHLVDGEQASLLVAFDKHTGHEVWRTPRDSRGCWTSPVLAKSRGGAGERYEIVVNGTGSASGSPGEIIAYDPHTGSELWRVRGTTDIPCPTAIVGEDLIVSSTGGNGPILALRGGGSGDVTASHVAWKHSSGGPYVPTGVIYQQRLFLVNDAGMLTCRSLDDGDVVWRKRLHGAFSASLVAGAGHVYAVSEKGDVYVFRAGDKYELVATNRLHEPCLATPAIAHGEIYLRTQQHLYCLAVSEPPSADPASLAPSVEPATIRSPADRPLEATATDDPS